MLISYYFKWDTDIEFYLCVYVIVLNYYSLIELKLNTFDSFVLDNLEKLNAFSDFLKSLYYLHD